MRRIALVNQKGGVGKTTTAVNLSAAIARLDRRVLLIDLDPQSNATVSLGIPPDLQKNTTYSLLNGGPFEPLKLSDTFHLVPSNIELAGAEMELTSVIGREIVLREALANISGYDFVFLDCSPSLGLLSVNALTTAKEVMVPLQCEFLALHGISLLLRTVELVKKRLNPELAITGVIPCMYDARKGLARDVVVEIEKHFGSRVFKSKIRSNVRLAEAPSHGKSIFDYAPDSFGAEDYLALAREIVGIETIRRETAPLAVVEPVAEVILPPDLEVPLPVPELVVAGGMAEAVAPVVDVPPQIQAIAPVLEAPVPVAEPYIPPPAPEPVAERSIPAPAPEPVSIPEPVVQAPAPEPVSAPEPEPAPAIDIVSDGVVEFIELIPLEIEELPYIEPEPSA
jgi:chromosome partitioning protein